MRRVVRRVRPLADRFWAKVDKVAASPCWLWTGSVNRRTGYGYIGLGRRGEGMVLTHHVAWALTYGGPFRGLYLCHSCDTPRCVNPVHLSEGTPAINSADMVRKGRSRRGERHGRAKMTEAEILELRQLRSEGWTYYALGDRYGITHVHARRLALGLAWRHLNQEELCGV